MTETKQKAGKVYGLIPKLMAEVGVIGKTQTNKFDNYEFRGIDDVLNALQPALIKVGLCIVPHLDACKVEQTRTSKDKPQMTAWVEVTYTLYADDGSGIAGKVAGEGADRGDKAVNKAMSSAMKNFCFQCLCIPTDTATDSENESSDVRTQTPPKAPPSNAPSTTPASSTGDQVTEILDLADKHKWDIQPVLEYYNGAGQVADLSESQAKATLLHWHAKANEAAKKGKADA